eukprot:1169342-Pleurochrysis_carterae.AAC.2
MLTHCEQMCQHCQICRSRDTPSAGRHVATGVTPDPPFPFHKISIEHKTVATPRSTGYHYILVVLDILIRFVTAIPTKTMSAEETLTDLMEHVFIKYSFPLVFKSDKGTAFRNELMAHFSKYAGFRNAYVLHYNAQANGMAKQSVGRITRLLVRHTQQFVDWPATLPMVTFALNCIHNLLLDTFPFFALCGRHPISLPELKNPQLYEVTETEHEFVDSLAFRLRQARSAVRDISVSVRVDAAAKSDSHYKRWLQPNTLDSMGGIQVGDKVLLLHGSVEYAAMLKKHGYPPLRTFRSIEVMPEYTALRVDSYEGYRHSTSCEAPATTVAMALGNPYELGDTRQLATQTCLSAARGFQRARSVQSARKHINSTLPTTC